MKTPKVSIIIPVYQGEAFLRDAIDSALAQTYTNLEVIVVNDGSQDDGVTERVALSYREKIKYIYKDNGGISSALNTGIKVMSGEYFSWLSHDDLYDSRKIEIQVSKIQNTNEVILCKGCHFVDGEGAKTKDVDIIDHKTYRMSAVELFEKNLYHSGFNGLGMLVPKKAFEDAGYFDESLKYAQDYDMWLRIMFKEYHFVVHDDVLTKSRIHPGQTTNLLRDTFVIDKELCARKHIDLLLHENVRDKQKWLELLMLSLTREQVVGQMKEIRSILKRDYEYTLEQHLKCIKMSVFSTALVVFREQKRKKLARVGLRN